MAAESALVAIIPEAEAVVGEHRLLLDPSAAHGLSAHVTLLYPFLPPDRIDFEVRRKLNAVAEAQRPFEVSFARTRWFGDEVLWLAPTPDAEFRSLIDALYGRFPETPPYGGTMEPVPHLTIGARADLAAMRRAEAAVLPQLPITASIGTLSLIAWSPEVDSWQLLDEFALRGR